MFPYFNDEEREFETWLDRLYEAHEAGASSTVISDIRALYLEAVTNFDNFFAELYDDHVRRDASGWYGQFAAFATAESVQFARCTDCRERFLYQPHDLGSDFCGHCRNLRDPFSGRSCWFDEDERPRDPITWELIPLGNEPF